MTTRNSTKSRMALSLAERLARMSQVDPSTGCIVWVRWRNANGYGEVGVNGKKRGAHRVAYELARGAVPDGLVLDHLCRNRACINPDHLEPVTQRENLLRGESFAAVNAAKTHCKQGHPFNEEHSRIVENGKRKCVTCKRHRDAARHARMRGEQ